MRMLYARYNEQVNAIDIVNYEMNYILRLRCDEWEEGIHTTMSSQRYLDALAIDNPLEYARLALSGEMQTWVEAMDEEWDIG